MLRGSSGEQRPTHRVQPLLHRGHRRLTFAVESVQAPQHQRSLQQAGQGGQLHQLRPPCYCAQGILDSVGRRPLDRLLLEHRNKLRHLGVLTAMLKGDPSFSPMQPCPKCTNLRGKQPQFCRRRVSIVKTRHPRVMSEMQAAKSTPLDPNARNLKCSKQSNTEALHLRPQAASTNPKHLSRATSFRKP